MNKERDFLRGISPNDALLTAAALAMMQRKEEREKERERDDLQSFIMQRLSAAAAPHASWGRRWIERLAGFRIARNLILD